jgi:hypothetical protein
MEYKKSRILPLVFIVTLFICGCVSLPQPADDSTDKDAKINGLQEIIDDQQRQLRELSDRLNEYETNTVNPEKAAAAGNQNVQE